jgi:hypothetical protein
MASGSGSNTVRGKSYPRTVIPATTTPENDYILCLTAPTVIGYDTTGHRRGTPRPAFARLEEVRAAPFRCTSIWMLRRWVIRDGRRRHKEER